jgi:hypothetical protein
MTTLRERDVHVDPQYPELEESRSPLAAERPVRSPRVRTGVRAGKNGAVTVTNFDY